MNYQLFRKIMSNRGLSARERTLNQQKRSFDLWFENAPNKELVNIDGVEQYAIFQDVNQSNDGELSDDKYVITALDSNMKVGSYITWGDKTFIVFTEEIRSMQTHKQSKVKVANQTIKWMIDGKVSGNGNGYPAFVKNQTLYTLGVDTSGKHAWIVNAKMNMFMQDNPETRAIKIGQRLFIGGDVYQVMFRDYLSRVGLINFLLEEHFVNPSKDNIELGIADYYTSGLKNDTSQGEPIDNGRQIIISGVKYAKIGSTVQYNAKVIQDGKDVEEDITEWAIIDADGVATVIEQTTDHITLKINNDFRKVGSVITIVGKTFDGVTGSATVNIISPY